MLDMLGRSSNQFSAWHTGSKCLRGPLLILSPSACATVAHLFPSSSLPRTRKDGARDAGFPSSSLPHTRKDGARDAGFLSLRIERGCECEKVSRDTTRKRASESHGL